MLGSTAVGWPDVVLALIAAVPSSLTLVLAYLLRRDVKTPSGDTLGSVAERTHDTTHATLAQTTLLVDDLAEKRNGHAD